MLSYKGVISVSERRRAGNEITTFIQECFGFFFFSNMQIIRGGIRYNEIYMLDEVSSTHWISLLLHCSRFIISYFKVFHQQVRNFPRYEGVNATMASAFDPCFSFRPAKITLANEPKVVGPNTVYLKISIQNIASLKYNTARFSHDLTRFYGSPPLLHQLSIKTEKSAHIHSASSNNKVLTYVKYC